MKFLQYIAIIVIVLECTTAQQEFDALVNFYFPFSLHDFFHFYYFLLVN